VDAYDQLLREIVREQHHLETVGMLSQALGRKETDTNDDAGTGTSESSDTDPDCEASRSLARIEQP
jgi:hypothetical protein